MDKVITIHDWWDGPLTGLAFYSTQTCFYERIFDDFLDEWGKEYFLTPIDSETEKIILNDWKLWCDAVKNRTFDMYYSQKAHSAINDRVKSLPKYHLYRKKAKFNGEFENGYIPTCYFVEWIDSL